MEPKEILIDDRLKTPRAAAVAGIVFSELFIISMVLIRLTVTTDTRDTGT